MADEPDAGLILQVAGGPAAADPVLHALTMAYPHARLTRLDPGHPGPGPASTGPASTGPAGTCTIDQARPCTALADALAAGYATAYPPAMIALRRLGVAVAATVPLDAEDDAVHSFLRQHGWGAWVRTGGRACSRVWHWPDVLTARAALEASTAGTPARGASYLQAHVDGQALRVGAAALDGRTLACTAVERVAADPAAWTVTAVPADIEAAFRALLSACRWTGGAEIMLRCPGPGAPLAVAVRPRFPDWTGGAAACGVNLPAELVRAVTGKPPARQRARATAFARVPHDVAVMSPATPGDCPSPSPAGHRAAAPSSSWPDDIPEHPLRGDLAEIVAATVPTPQWRLLPRVARSRFARAADLQAESSTSDVVVKIAYSVKTNPDPRMIELALQHGLLVEAISQDEVTSACRAGFRPDQIVLNGPAKWWPAGQDDGRPYHAVFCDSLTELARTVAERRPVLGLRLRPRDVPSRFGIPVADVAGAVRLLADAPEQVPLAVHFHYPGVVVGFARWWTLVNETVASAARLQAASGRTVTMLDIGGGWHPLDWHHGWLDEFRRFAREIRGRLPGLTEIIIEPGEALAQPAGAVMTRVLESRPGADPEIVVDASVAELREAPSYPHPILVHRTTGWDLVPPGRGRVLGRLCMELDVLACGVDVGQIPDGSLLCFTRAGSYDRSMSYDFGRGPGRDAGGRGQSLSS